MKHFTTLMKKMCVLAVMLLAGMFTAKAADFMVDSICYNIIGDNEVEVTSRDVKYTGEVSIPSSVTFDNIIYQVTAVGNQAFSGCQEMTNIDIPEGVTRIGNYAFSSCKKLESVEFPTSLISIGEYVFSGCDLITSIYLPRNVAQIAAFAFYNCDIAYYMCSSNNNHFKAVNGVLYSKDMTRLEAYPNAAEATSFSIPSTVTTIQKGAFANAINLAQVSFPESVVWIGASAFRNCDVLETVDFSDNIRYIGPACLYNCDKLAYVHLPASLDTIKNGVFSKLPALTELTIPRNVKFIDNFAFSESRALKTVNFEEGSCLLGIGLRSFDYCTSLESFDMPNTVTTMDVEVFGNCTALKSVHLSDNLVDMNSSTFWGCSALTECEIPGGVRSLKNVLIACTALKRVKIGDKNSAPGITTIKNCGIARCYQLEYLELGANVDSLESSAINDLDSLKVIICWAATPPKCHNYWSSFSPEPAKLNATLYVPKAYLEAYRTAKDWKDFRAIYPIEDVGDVNGDSNISIADVTALINILLSGETTAAIPLGDIDFDGKISISDVTSLINRLLSSDI